MKREYIEGNEPTECFETAVNPAAVAILSADFILRFRTNIRPVSQKFD